MRIERMSMLGVSVKDLDEAVARYTDLFGLEFEILKPGVEYPVHDALGGTDISAPAMKAGGRIAIDRTECFELVELPNEPEGTRNIHFRVDDIDAASAHMMSRGLRMVRDMLAGAVRETVFNSEDLNGVRLCLMQYEGDSFIDALRAEPPSVK